MIPRQARPSERGFSFLGVMVVVAIMLVMMAVAMPSWDYLARNDKEEELIFRAGQIGDAILAFKSQRGGALPTSLDELVRGKFLRKAYGDPMTKDGKWRFIHPGEMPVLPASGKQAGPVSAVPTPAPLAKSPFGSGQSLGPFIGVASTSQEKSLRIVNQGTQYDKWQLIADQSWFLGMPPHQTCIRLCQQAQPVPGAPVVK